jgi:hypothetical protein
MTTATYPFPKWGKTILPPAHIWLGSTSVLHKQQPSDGVEYPMHFAKRTPGVGNTA